MNTMNETIQLTWEVTDSFGFRPIYMRCICKLLLSLFTRQHLLLKIRSFCWRWKQRFSSSFDTELTRLAFISKTFNYINRLLLISLLRMLHDLLRHHREEDVHFRQNKIILNRVYFFRYSLSSNIYRFVSGNVGCFNPITPSRSTTLGIWKTSGNARMFC